MNDRKNRQTKTLMRCRQFLRDHGIVEKNPGIGPLAAVVAQLDAALDEVFTRHANQMTGTAASHAAVEDRQRERKALRSMLSDFARVARTLDPLVYRDIAAQLKMGRLNSQASLLAYARNAVSVLTPVQSVFIAHGAPATFIAEIEAGIAAYEQCGVRQNRGLGLQICSNEAIAHAVRDGMTQLRRLDGILSLLLRAQPAVLAEWKVVMRLEKRNSKPATPQPAASPTASASEPKEGSFSDVVGMAGPTPSHRVVPGCGFREVTPLPSAHTEAGLDQAPRECMRASGIDLASRRP